MTEQAKRIKNIMNMTYVDNDALNQVIKDRLDFGFDSIYFRYAEVCDELAAYIAMYEHVNPVEARKRMNNKKMHFYEALEQLIHAHEEVDNDSHQ